MKKLLTIFGVLLLIASANAQEMQPLEDFINKNTNLKSFSFESKKKETVKLITFSDSDTQLKFLLVSDNAITPWAESDETDIEDMPDIFAISAVIDDSDVRINFGRFGSFVNLDDSYKHPYIELQKGFDIGSDDCLGMDSEKWEKCNEEKTFTSCPGVFIEQSEKCVRAAIIDSVVSTNKDNEFGSTQFMNRMIKMDFKVEKIVVESNYFDVVEETKNKGYNPIGISVYTLNSKPIAWLEIGIVVD